MSFLSARFHTYHPVSYYVMIIREWVQKVGDLKNVHLKILSSTIFFLRSKTHSFISYGKKDLTFKLK